jgi:hypothetical protein
MVKRIIEMIILIVLIGVIVLSGVYFLNYLYQGVTLNPQISSFLKYMFIGSVGLVALIIVCGTVIVVTLGFLAIRWLSRITSGSYEGKKRGMAGISEFIGDIIETSVGSAISSVKDLKHLSSRVVDISIEFPYDTLKIKTANGDIKINGHNSNTISGRVEIYEVKEGDAEIFIEDGEIKLKTKSGKEAKLGDIELMIPSSLKNMDIESVNGDIFVKEIISSNNSVFKGVNGDISIDNFSNLKEVTVKTLNGDVDINNSKFFSIKIQSVSGNIKLRESSIENAFIKTVSGDIDYRNTEIKNPDVKTVSGDIIK